MLETLIEIVHVLVALFMILVVLVQGGNQGGVGAAFGGGNSSGVFGATGATSLLAKLTYGAAFIFMATSITLTVMQGKSGDIGLKDRLKQAGGAAPTDSAIPATPLEDATDGQKSEPAEPAAVTPAAPADATQPAPESPTAP